MAKPKPSTNAIARIADAVLGKTLDRLNGWKSILGLVGIVVGMVLEQLGQIDKDTAKLIYNICGGLFGVGVIHKVVKKEK